MILYWKNALLPMSLTILTKEFGKDRSSDGWKLFNDMESHLVSTNLSTYTTLLDGLCKNEETDEALSLLCMIEEKGVNPNEFTYGVMVNAKMENLMLR